MIPLISHLRATKERNPEPTFLRFLIFASHHETGYPYYFLWANQQKANIKILSWTLCEISKETSDWHILAGNEERILYRIVGIVCMFL